VRVYYSWSIQLPGSTSPRRSHHILVQTGTASDTLSGGVDAECR